MNRWYFTIFTLLILLPVLIFAEERSDNSKELPIGLIKKHSLKLQSQSKYRIVPTTKKVVLFQDDFESGLGNWAFAPGDWATVTYTSNSPATSVTESPGVDYTNGESKPLVINQRFDFASSGYISVSLSFYHADSTESGYDFAYAEVSTDSSNWTELGSYDGTSGWTQEIIDLSTYAAEDSVWIRFLFESDGSTVAPGWYLDDVVLEGFTTDNVPPTIVNVNGPASQFDTAIDDTVWVEATDNVGVDSAVVWYSLNDINGVYTPLLMTPTTGDSFIAVISAQPQGTKIYWKVEVNDVVGNASFDPAPGFVYTYSILPTTDLVVSIAFQSQYDAISSALDDLGITFDLWIHGNAVDYNNWSKVIYGETGSITEPDETDVMNYLAGANRNAFVLFGDDVGYFENTNTTFWPALHANYFGDDLSGTPDVDSLVGISGDPISDGMPIIEATAPWPDAISPVGAAWTFLEALTATDPSYAGGIAYEDEDEMFVWVPFEAGDFDSLSARSELLGRILGWADTASATHRNPDWYNTQWPPSITIDAGQMTGNIYGQVWEDGLTSVAGATAGLVAELGIGDAGTDPLSDASWTWTTAIFNSDVGNNDEFMASVQIDVPGNFSYCYRYSLNSGGWVYGDLDGSDNGFDLAQMGALTVNSLEGTLKLLISEIVVTPTAGEFVEIFNPNSVEVDLSDYYLTDATYETGSDYYYNIVTGTNAGGGGSGDWHARFPDGAIIEAGEYQTIACAGDSLFFVQFGVMPTYELWDDGHAIPADAPDMLEAFSGSINDQGGLTNGDEVVIIYYWDGLADLVRDVDYLIYDDAGAVPNEAVDKTGVSIDGPDAGTDSSTYLDDTAIANQVPAVSPGYGFSTHRIDYTEGAQIDTAGNGITNEDETSEDLNNTFTNYSIPSPNAAYTAPTYTVDGSVTLADTSDLLEGTIVSILTWVDTTDANGYYQLADVDSGTYTINFSRHGYVGIDSVIVVTSNITVDVMLTNSPIAEDIFTINTPELTTAVTNEGTIGMLNSNGGSPGFTWGGSGQLLYEGGLMISTAPDHVVDAARAVIGGSSAGNLDADYQFLTNISVVANNSDSTVLVSSFDDSRASLAPVADDGPNMPIGLEVNQTTYSYTDSANSGYVIYKLEITNTTASTLEGILAGAYFDWDVGTWDANTGHVDFNSVTIPGVNGGNPFNSEFSYLYDPATSNVYVGAVPLNQNYFRASRILQQPDEVYAANFSEANKFAYMNERRASDPYGPGGGNDDKGLIFGLGGGTGGTGTVPDDGFTIAAGGTVTVGFAIVGGNSLVDFVDNGTHALHKWAELGNSITVFEFVTGIEDEMYVLPAEFALRQNYPNPFNPTTTIKYQLPKKADVKIVIYNMLGQAVRTIVDKAVDAGYQEVVWDGLNEIGSRVASGIYIYRMEADKFVKSHKMIMMK